MSHRISPPFVVPFEKWKEGTDLFQDLETQQNHLNSCLMQQTNVYPSPTKKYNVQTKISIEVICCK